MIEIENLNRKARELRKRVLDLVKYTGEGHLGGSFSEIEILISLYNGILNETDKFILSKGHACYPLYILLGEKGCNPKLAGHPDIDCQNGVNCTTGSLGHGLPIGVGIALARKKMNKIGKVYVLIGDGECQEGTIWESSLIASRCKLDNLVVIVDKNNFQALDKTDNILPLGDLKEKFRNFGYEVSEINGHNFEEIFEALKKQTYEKSHMIIANTIKGKGISFMENNAPWHAKTPNQEELNQAYKELGFLF